MPSKTVLLIESDPYHRDILTCALEHHEYLVISIDLEELPAMVEELLQPDLMVIAYPGHFADGRPVFDWIRSSSELRDVPIICVSGDSGQWSVDEALASGCNVVCVKPIDAGRFAVQVRQLIGPSND